MSASTTLAAPLQGILTDCSKAISRHTTHIKARIAALEDEVLPHQLKIGLHCLKAHMAFVIQDPAKRGAMKGKKSSSIVDGLSPQGFEGWLLANHPSIKKPTAYRWMTALKGLDLNESNTEADVEKALARAAKELPALSIKALCDAALDPIGPPPAPPQKIEQQEFDFLRQSLSAFRDESENLCRIKDKLDAHPDFKRAATARVYGILYELTGTHWAPSDEPDALATIDPDTITL